jgi:CTP synthase (UTP-ammonia lyase)
VRDDEIGRGRWVAVIGDRQPGFVAQDAIDAAVEHAAAALGWPSPALRWVATDHVGASGAEVLTGACGVWCAPGSPYVSLEGALAGIRWAREARVPFIGTCAGFQHAAIEYVRNVLGHGTAGHAEYGDVDGPGEAGPMVVDELACSLVGQTMGVEIVDPELRDAYGTGSVLERYYCRFGLDPAWRAPLHDAGLRVAGVDERDGDVRVMRLDGHPFYVLTLFVPQVASRASAPHPLVSRFVAAALGVRAGATPERPAVSG